MKIGLGKKQKRESKELGFGTKAYGPNTRLIKPGGDFNVDKKGLRFWESLDIYHELISMKWGAFLVLSSAVFFLVNLLFALLYFKAGIGSISGVSGSTSWEVFMDSFYFSTQTITTVGFGRLSPNTNYVSLLAALESFLGLMGFALVTGLIFARFSRPRKRLVYSEKAIIAPYKDINALMYRFSNGGKNRLIETQVEVFISYWNLEEERRIFEKLNLERDRINFLTTSWTVVHPIDRNSPLHGWTKADLDAQHVEVVIMFKAFDDTYARNIYDRRSYVSEEILWGKRFVPVFQECGDGKIHIDLDKIGDLAAAKLN